jgi:hypothetical protein
MKNEELSRQSAEKVKVLAANGISHCYARGDIRSPGKTSRWKEI